MERNQHVKDYLTYYVRFLPSPHFAVLLNGPWGIGKTFFVKEFMKPFREDGFRHVYVSLYGLTSLDAIDGALFRALYPLLDDKGVRLVGHTIKALGKYFRVDADFSFKDFFDKDKSGLFIFDDLERCQLPINKVLGYINEFVEHKGCKVIILANEKEIKESEEYLRIREKLIGKTLEIQSVFEQALEAFVESSRDNQMKGFFKSKIEEISEVYHQSELHNLRVLQQTMWDFEIFYVATEEKHRANDAAMTVLLRLLFCLSFELKAGRLTNNDLANRQSLFTFLNRTRQEEGASPQDKPARRRYPEVELYTTIISSETLANLLFKGMVDQAQICLELNASSFFVTVADEPAWRTVWHAYERTEEEFNTALAEMERAFAAHELTVPGEILHVFGIRLWLSKIGVIPKSLDEVVTEGKAYVDALYENRQIVPASHQDFSDTRLEGYSGLSIHECSTLEYQELYSYLSEKRQIAAVDCYPTIANELLEDMKTNPDLFFRRINLTNDGANEFYNIPVLASLDPQAFVSAFLGQHPSRQHAVLTALKFRYEHGRLDGERELKEERLWAIEIRNRLYTEAENFSAISKHCIREFLHRTLDEVLFLGKYARETVDERQE